MESTDQLFDPEIVLALEPREAAALAWILDRFLHGVPRPHTPIQGRLAGMKQYLRDALPDNLRLPGESSLPRSA